MIHILLIPSFFVGPHAGYPDQGFCDFSQSFQANNGIAP
jgi:hypothetical protein